MGAMTCHRGAMLVTLILVATAASCHGARPSSSLADMLMARHLNQNETTDDDTASSVSILTSSVSSDNEEQLSTDAPVQEDEPVVDQEEPKPKPRPKPKNSLMERTRELVSRRRAQSRFKTGDRRPTSTRLTTRTRNNTRWTPRRRNNSRHKSTTTLQSTITSTTSLVPITTSTEKTSNILPTKGITLATPQMTNISEEVEDFTESPTFTSTTSLKTKTTEANRYAQSRYRAGSRPTGIFVTPRSRNTPRVTFRPRRNNHWKSTTPAQPINTSITSLVPITASTEKPSNMLSIQNTTLATPQMTTMSEEVDTTTYENFTESPTFTTTTTLQTTTTAANRHSQSRYKPGSRPTGIRVTPRPRNTPRWTPKPRNNIRYTPTPRTTIGWTPKPRKTTYWIPKAVTPDRWKPRTTMQPTTRSTTNLSPITTSPTTLVPITSPSTTLAPIATPSTTLAPKTTSTTTLAPITTSTAQPSSIFTTQATLPSTQILFEEVDSFEEAESTLPADITEQTPFTTSTTLQPTLDITNDSRQRTTIGWNPKPRNTTYWIPKHLTLDHRKPSTTMRPTTTSTTTMLPKSTHTPTLAPITTSTAQPSFIETQTTSLPITEITTTSEEFDSTFPTEIPESATFSTYTASQNTLNKTNIYNDDSLTTTTTTRSTTTTTSNPTTEASSQEIQTTEEAGHSGEVFLVEEKDIPNLKIPKPLKSWSTLKPSIPKPVLVGSGLNVGVGLNIEDPDDGLEMLGPVLILGNNLRRRRQHHSESNITNETDELATDTPIETTINPFNNGLEENDYETTLGPLLFDRRISSTAPPPTPDESTLNLTDVYDTTIKDNSDTESNVAIETASNIVSAPEFQEITVGTKVNLGGPKVTGEVIPVELKSNPQVEKEHKSEGGIELNSDREDDQITSVSDRPERPGTSSLLGSLLNWWTETPEKPLQKRPQRPESPERPLQERPQIFRPERPGIRPERPGTQSGERPEFRPFTFRPRPRPTENRPDILPPRPTENRPDILPPRLRLPPIVADPISDITTNRPLDTTIISDDSPAEEPPLRSPIRFTARPRPTGLLNKPSSRPGFLPSKPVIESGFQGIRDEFGNTRPAGLFRPGAPEEINDNDYDSDALPPSLPNLKIIPFVAADALTNQPEGNIDSFAGDDFRISLQEEPATTTTTTTTTEASIRRPFVPGIRRPPILPARRPLRPDANGRPNINGRPNSTGRPSPFAPGQRPTRPGTRRPFLPPRNTPRDKITSEENSIAPSSTTPSSPPILRFTSKKPAAEFTLLPVEKTTVFVQPEPEEEVTTDDLPSIESNTVNTPEGPLRLPGPIITKTTESSSSSSISSKPIKTDDISNLFLQDIFGQPEGTKRPPVRFIPASSKPITPTKTRTPLPAIPSLITNLFPLAPDPIVAQGLLKLSGCNIYGRMYNIDDRISELSAKCKECRCTPVGVQCLPVCA